ncbi:hypothetical protein UCRPC4_g02892 [Phaeomoniella chlamydospora]|uniref:DUF7908 domain-containing protein n=1 Tax=Phaeomoniella chlamydospora TaxID=158046 RepID=A0A0G2EMA2_PHACM|nr:hypothetical protein UCRPC4_g02892 [Phaeomoniella chlamydospora]
MKYTTLSAAAAALIAGKAVAQDTCTASGVVVAPTAVEYPIYISTYVADATIININNNINITIDYAPTTINTIITGTSTVFNTVTATVTTTAVPSPTATTVDEPIILGINANIAKNKRQNAFSGFLGAAADVVDSCTEAQTLTLNGGSLYTTSGEQFSASVDDTSVSFEASTTVGSIYTTFGLLDGFVWVNSAFVGGEAIFCVTTEGSVAAGFEGVTPAGCTAIGLTALLASSCSGNSTSSASGSATSSANITGSLTSSSSLSFTSTASLTTVSSSSLSNTTSATSTSTSDVTSIAGSTVQLTFSTGTAAAKVKRQSTTQYVTGEGTFSDDPADAADFVLTDDGYLYAGITPFGATSGDDYEQFVAGAGTDIETTFSLTNGFAWANESFSINTANTAEFAVSASTIFAAFATLPPGATVVAITPVPAGTSVTATSSTSSEVSTTSDESSSSTSDMITSDLITSSTSVSTTSSSVSGLPTSDVNTTATALRRSVPKMPRLPVY